MLLRMRDRQPVRARSGATVVIPRREILMPLIRLLPTADQLLLDEVRGGPLSSPSHETRPSAYDPREDEKESGSSNVPSGGVQCRRLSIMHTHARARARCRSAGGK